MRIAGKLRAWTVAQSARRPPVRAASIAARARPTAEFAAPGTRAHREHPERVNTARLVGDDKGEAVDDAKNLGNDQGGLLRLRRIGGAAPQRIAQGDRPRKPHLHEADHWHIGVDARLELPDILGLV